METLYPRRLSSQSGSALSGLNRNLQVLKKIHCTTLRGFPKFEIPIPRSRIGRPGYSLEQHWCSFLFPVSRELRSKGGYGFLTSDLFKIGKFQFQKWNRKFRCGRDAEQFFSQVLQFQVQFFKIGKIAVKGRFNTEFGFRSGSTGRDVPSPVEKAPFQIFQNVDWAIPHLFWESSVNSIPKSRSFLRHLRLREFFWLEVLLEKPMPVQEWWRRDHPVCFFTCDLCQEFV